MLTLNTDGFGTSFWTILTSTSTNTPSSPIGEAPKLVYLCQDTENVNERTWSYSSISSEPSSSPSSIQKPLDIQSDISCGVPRPRPRKHGLKDLMCHLKPAPSQPKPPRKIKEKPRREPRSKPKPKAKPKSKSKPKRELEPHECFANHCTLCKKEIPPTHFYANRPKKILQDNTYISTRCCHQTVHSPCYRITLQYFIDSKGRPRCPICREYPDLFVACWSLGYVFDKDVGDIDDEECDCGEDVRVWCNVCQGRKKLLKDLRRMREGKVNEKEMELDEGVGLMGPDKCVEKGVKLFTIIEGDEED